jgi:hypothetical protein
VNTVDPLSVQGSQSNVSRQPAVHVHSAPAGSIVRSCLCSDWSSGIFLRPLARDAAHPGQDHSQAFRHMDGPRRI